MRASQLSEEEAFRRLRQASMHSQRRVGLVAQQLIDGARDAEAINRAGQLRMLSQRVVKLTAMEALDGPAADAQSLMQASLDRAAANLDALTRLLSQPTFGDFVEALRDDWDALRRPARRPVAERARHAGRGLPGARRAAGQRARRGRQRDHAAAGQPVRPPAHAVAAGGQAGAARHRPASTARSPRSNMRCTGCAR